MRRPQALIVRAPGTNCDRETAFALELAGADVEILHVNRLLQEKKYLTHAQILCLPGGFSYGDDIAAGRILANEIQNHLADAMAQFRDHGKLILGICNGFQVLIKTGLLLSNLQNQKMIAAETTATLTWNDSGKFEDRWVHLKTIGDKSALLAGVQRMYLPVAHAEGKFFVAAAEKLDRLEASGQLVLRYCNTDHDGDAAVRFPQNPNGSLRDVAGVCDETGQVLGLMPHPERYIDRTQHPRWTRGEGEVGGDGMAIFKNAVRFFS